MPPHARLTREVAEAGLCRLPSCLAGGKLAGLGDEFHFAVVPPSAVQPPPDVVFCTAADHLGAALAQAVT